MSPLLRPSILPTHGSAMPSPPQQNASLSPPTSPRRTVAHRGSPHHVPGTPSRLRESVAAGSDRSLREQQDEGQLTPLSSPILGSQPLLAEPEAMASANNHGTRAGLVEPSQREADARTRLLEDYHKASVCGARDCNHGTFSPHVRAQGSASSNVSTINEFVGPNEDGIHDENGESGDTTRPVLGDTVAGRLCRCLRRGTSKNTTRLLASKHGVKNQRTM